MVYKVIWDKEAYNFLSKLDSFLAKRIVKLIKEFSEDINSKGYKKLVGRDGFRLRAGDYRIIFDFNHASQTIFIFKIGHRKNIYE